MQRLSGDRRPLGEALDLDFSGLGAQLARVRGVAGLGARSRATALMTAALSAAWLLAPTQARDPAGARAASRCFPLEIARLGGHGRAAA